MFMLFAGCVYYPLGGIKDFKGYFECSDEAKRHIEELFKDDSCMWAHITLADEIVCHGIKYYDDKMHEFWEWVDINEA